MKKINKTIGLSAKVANTEAARKRGGMQKNSARTGTFHGGIIATESPRHGEVFGYTFLSPLAATKKTNHRDAEARRVIRKSSQNGEIFQMNSQEREGRKESHRIVPAQSQQKCFGLVGKGLQPDS